MMLFPLDLHQRAADHQADLLREAAAERLARQAVPRRPSAVRLWLASALHGLANRLEAPAVQSLSRPSAAA